MDWRTIKNRKEKYAAYLASREWAERREAVMQRAGGKCERCRTNDATAVHHLTYARIYAELPEDLQAICEGCHRFIHAKSDANPAAAVCELFPDEAAGMVEFETGAVGILDWGVPDNHLSISAGPLRDGYAEIRVNLTGASKLDVTLMVEAAQLVKLKDWLNCNV